MFSTTSDSPFSSSTCSFRSSDPRTRSASLDVSYQSRSARQCTKQHPINSAQHDKLDNLPPANIQTVTFLTAIISPALGTDKARPLPTGYGQPPDQLPPLAPLYKASMNGSRLSVSANKSAVNLYIEPWQVNPTFYARRKGFGRGVKRPYFCGGWVERSSLHWLVGRSSICAGPRRGGGCSGKLSWSCCKSRRTALSGWV